MPASRATIEYTKQGGPSSSHCGVCSIKGHKPGNPNWTNQDNYAISECVGGDASTRVYVVLDGHGEHGHLVSQRCHENLPKYLMSTEYNLKVRERERGGAGATFSKGRVARPLRICLNNIFPNAPLLTPFKK